MSYSQYATREISLIRKSEYITIPEASVLTRIGLNSIYKMVKEPDADYVICVGEKRKRILINRKQFLKYLRDCSTK